MIFLAILYLAIFGQIIAQFKKGPSTTTTTCHITTRRRDDFIQENNSSSFGKTTLPPLSHLNIF